MQEKLDKFYQLWLTVQPELEEAGIIRGPLRLPARINADALERALTQLETFVTSEALILFRKARDLRPPGILRVWADDELTRSARETQVYLSARRLLKELWREQITLKRLILRSYKNENR